jgi:hypothetical protein
MHADTTHNGWTNYETWNVALWLANDEWSYNLTRDMARNARDSAADLPERFGDARGNLANELETMVKDSAPDLSASMFSDLLGAALSEVNWYEIAGNLLDDDD